MLSLIPLPDVVTICRSTGALDSWGNPIQEDRTEVPARVKMSAMDDKDRATVYLRGSEQIAVNDAMIISGETLQVVQITPFKDLSGAVIHLKVTVK